MDFDYKNKPVLEWNYEDLRSFLKLGVTDPEALKFFENLSKKEKYFLGDPGYKKIFKFKSFKYHVELGYYNIKRFGLNCNHDKLIEFKLSDDFDIRFKFRLFKKLFDLETIYLYTDEDYGKLKEK